MASVSNGRLKVAVFSVRATVQQSARWKKAAEHYGFPSVGAWLAEAADRHLDALARAGQPLPLAWRQRRFTVRLVEGNAVEVKGWAAEPFGIFRGDAAGPGYQGCHIYTLAYLPDGRLLATFRYAQHCRTLAAELARLWVRWGGTEPAEDAGPVVERHVREAL